MGPSCMCAHRAPLVSMIILEANNSSMQCQFWLQSLIQFDSGRISVIQWTHKPKFVSISSDGNDYNARLAGRINFGIHAHTVEIKRGSCAYDKCQCKKYYHG